MRMTNRIVKEGCQLKYYSEHAEEYIESTLHTDMRTAYGMVEKYIGEGASILDVGFGSGRDMIYFSSKGYDVEGIDMEERFVTHALKQNLVVHLGDAMTYQTSKKYDLVWCCACLLHLQRAEIKEAIDNLYSLLKTKGIFFISMKYSSKEDGYDDQGRFFTYFSKKDIDGFPYPIEEIALTKDAKREDLEWVNLIIKKK
jgi:2-polyprenyl-3-methyl-5-hydroxy-6-metoxy-1,4-benzoquinol methylase